MKEQVLNKATEQTINKDKKNLNMEGSLMKKYSIEKNITATTITKDEKNQKIKFTSKKELSIQKIEHNKKLLIQAYELSEQLDDEMKSKFQAILRQIRLPNIETLTATEIGAVLNNTSARKINKLLEDLGMQTKSERGRWNPTRKAYKYTAVTTYIMREGDNKILPESREWLPSIIEFLKKEIDKETSNATESAN